MSILVDASYVPAASCLTLTASVGVDAVFGIVDLLYVSAASCLTITAMVGVYAVFGIVDLSHVSGPLISQMARCGSCNHLVLLRLAPPA